MKQVLLSLIPTLTFTAGYLLGLRLWRRPTRHTSTPTPSKPRSLSFRIKPND